MSPLASSAERVFVIVAGLQDIRSKSYGGLSSIMSDIRTSTFRRGSS